MIRSRLLLALAASTLTFIALPASAKMMSCTGENMAKSSTAMMGMPDTPGRRMADKEIGMANMDMSKGNMRSACAHYMRAQKMAAMKSGRGMMGGGKM